MLRAGASLLRDNEAACLNAVFAIHDYRRVEVAWGISQCIVAFEWELGKKKTRPFSRHPMDRGSGGRAVLAIRGLGSIRAQRAAEALGSAAAPGTSDETDFSASAASRSATPSIASRCNWSKRERSDCGYKRDSEEPPSSGIREAIHGGMTVLEERLGTISRGALVFAIESDGTERPSTTPAPTMDREPTLTSP